MESRQSKSRRRVQLIVVALLAILLFPAASLADDISLVKSNQWVNGTNTFIPENLGGYYWISGRVTSPFLSHTNLTEFYVQDASAGIRVLSKGALFTLETNETTFPLGVQVSVYGQIVQSNGLCMIRPERFNGDAYDTNDITQDFFISGTTTSPVTPEEISIATLLADGEGYEGKLVKLTNVYYVGSEAWTYNQSSQLTVTDLTGSISFYIDRDTDLDGQLPPVGAFDLIGIAGQYSTNLVPSNGYEVIGRRYVDVIQSVGPVAPSLSVPTNATAVVGNTLNLYVIGQDRNASDVLTLSTNAGPTNGTFTVIAAREGKFTWTPTLDILGTTTRVEFVVSDGSTTVTSTCAIVVRRASGGPGFVWINEFHYDNAGNDTNEGVEVAGPAGIDLSSYYILLYNGGNGAIYLSNSLSGTVDNEGNGYGAVWIPYAWNAIQNGAPDGIALCHKTNGLLQFISYEGFFTGVGGPADGVASIDVGVSELGTETAGQSLQLAGSGTNYEDFTWSGPKSHTRGYLNDPDQTVVGAIDADVQLSLLTLAPEKPETNQAFDVTCVVEPNYYAGGLSVTAYYSVNGGTTNTIAMGDEGNNLYKTVSQIPGQTNNSTVSYFVEASFTGSGTNSPRVTLTNEIVIRAAPTGNVTALINEIDPNSAGAADADGFIEIIALAGQNLENCFVVHYNGNNTGDGGLFRFDFPYFIVPDDGITDTNGNALGFCVIGTGVVANVDFILPADMENGPDGLVLYDRNSNILDAVAWEGTNDMTVDDPGTVSVSVPSFQPNYLHITPDDNSDTGSIQAPNNVVADTGAGWQVLTTTPGTINGAQTSGVIQVIYGGSTTNFPPNAIVLNPSGTNKSVIVSNLLSFTVSCTESDGDALTLYTNALPANAAFYATNGTGTAIASFTFTPDATQTGVHTITFYAQDKDGTTDITVQLTVTPISGGGGSTGTVCVVNEFRNATPDVVELLVISNSLNMQGIIVKDYSSSGAGDSGGGYTFAANALWASVRSGTLIVLRNDTTAVDVVTGGADYNLDVGLRNTNYFVIESGSFDIATEEMVQIKAAGSPKAGHAGAIHTMASAGISATNYAAAPNPKLKATSGNSQSGESVYAKNSTSTLSDFDGTDAQGDDTTGSLGTWNTAANRVYIESLRGGGSGPVDTDADGMSDDYETTYWTNATAGVAGDDDDGDGFSNLEEYLADTIPNGAAGSNSLFEIQAFTNSTPRSMVFPSSTGRVYTLQITSDLLLGDSWSNLQTDVQGDGGPMTLTDPVETGSRGYRLRVRVP